MITSQLNSKEQAWLNSLAGIEQQYAAWFRKRPAIFDQDECDHITNHVFTESHDGQVTISFWKYSELPEDIKAACINAYHELFGAEVAA